MSMTQPQRRKGRKEIRTICSRAWYHPPWYLFSQIGFDCSDKISVSIGAICERGKHLLITEGGLVIKPITHSVHWIKPEWFSEPGYAFRWVFHTLSWGPDNCNKEIPKVRPVGLVLASTERACVQFDRIFFSSRGQTGDQQIGEVHHWTTDWYDKVHGQSCPIFERVAIR